MKTKAAPKLLSKTKLMRGYGRTGEVALRANYGMRSPIYKSSFEDQWREREL